MDGFHIVILRKPMEKIWLRSMIPQKGWADHWDTNSFRHITLWHRSPTLEKKPRRMLRDRLSFSLPSFLKRFGRSIHLFNIQDAYGRRIRTLEHSGK